jgi:HAMP domain-containing protein
MRFQIGLTPRLVSIIVAVAAAVAFAVSWNARSSLRETLATQLESKGEAIAIALASNLSSNTEDTLATSLFSIKGQIDASKAISGVGYIYVQGADKNVLAHTFPTNRFPPKLAEANFVKPGEWPADKRVKSKGIDVEVPGEGGAGPTRTPAIDVAAPIANGTLGMVHVGMDQNEIDQQVRSLIRNTVLWGVIGALFGTLFGVFFIIPVANRIRRMTDVALRIAAGDLSQQEVGSGSGDEVGRMAEAFNTMLRSLRDLAAAADRVAKGDLTVRLDM